MKSYEDRLPFIDEAIEYHNGKWPQDKSPYGEVCLVLLDNGNYITTMGITGKDGYLCNKHQFEKRAKELGWINGYKFGVEYETNGKKPDLPDDVTIEIECIRGRRDLVARLVKYNNWDMTKSFRIIDLSYEPKGESVSGIPASVLERVDRLLMKAEENQRMEDSQKEQKMNNDWYEKGEFPPVGSVVSFYRSNKHKASLFTEQWCEGDHLEVLAHKKGETEDVAVVWNQRLKKACGIVLGCLKPIRTETDKLVDEALETLKSNYATHLSFSDLDLKMCAEVMIEAGYRKVKPMSEDKFVQDALEYFDFEVSQFTLICEALRKLYSAGCRFIDQGE